MLVERRRRWVLIGIVGLAFALRVVGLDFQSLWRDEVDAILFAGKPLTDLLHTFVEPGQNGPLYFLGLRLWLGVAGRSEFALRFFSVVFGVLAVPLVFRLGRRLFPSLPAVALLGALLAATSPYLVWYGQEGKMYSLATFLILLSMERYLAALERGGWHRWLVYVVVTTMAFYVHLLAALIVAAQALVFLIAGRQVSTRRWKPWLASMAALTVPYLPLLIWQVPLLAKPGETGYHFVPLQNLLSSLMVSYSLGVVQGGTPWSLGLFVGLMLAAVFLLVGQPRWRAALGILFCWFLVPVAGLYLITLVRPLYTARYLIFALPAYLLLIAFALVAIGRRSKLVAALLFLSLLLLNGWGLWLQAKTPIKADFRAATRFVAQRLSSGDTADLILFQIPHGRYSFEYYYEPVEPRSQEAGQAGGYSLFLPLAAGRGRVPYRWAEGLYTNAGMAPEEAARQMIALTQDSRVVWLIATEVPMWDERNLVQGWLEEQAHLTDRVEFVRVVVYRYELP